MSYYILPRREEPLLLSSGIPGFMNAKRPLTNLTPGLFWNTVLIHSLVWRNLIVSLWIVYNNLPLSIFLLTLAMRKNAVCSILNLYGCDPWSLTCFLFKLCYLQACSSPEHIPLTPSTTFAIAHSNPVFPISRLAVRSNFFTQNTPNCETNFLLTSVKVPPFTSSEVYWTAS